MDQHGYFSFSCGICYGTTAARKARIVILEVNKNAPRTLGNSFIHISEVAAVVENDVPMPTLTIPPVTAVEQTIGNYIAELIPDGATIQIGFGGIPNAVCQALLIKKDLGVHTEMVTDGMVDLVEAGVINNSKKTFHPGKILGTFVLGTQRLYDFVNDNPMIEMHDVLYTNAPNNIGKNDNMCTVNAAIEVDLLGQCAAETIGTHFWSSTGGQADFGHGANISNGGKGFITVSATAKDGKISRIVPTLNHGAVVTTSKNSVDHIVTEYGVARLRGKTIGERAKALIAIAHPDFRDTLTCEAQKRGIIVS
jgi:acyl-CoA hydrolase